MKRICVFINSNNGCTLHRLLIPYQKLANISDDFDVDFFVKRKEFSYDDIANHVSGYDYFVFNRSMNVELLSKIKETGVKVICDNDDDWILGKNHPLYNYYLINGITEKIKLCMEMSDIVTTTTEHLAEKIRTVNKAVFVIPNALSSEG